MELEQRIEELLHGIGIPKHIKGFTFLRVALKHCMQDNAPVDRNLYTFVATKQLTNNETVRREIKHAIEVAYDRYDMPLHRRIFTGHFAPKNEDFIATLLRELKKD